MSEVKYVGLDKPDEGTIYAPLSRRSLARFLLVRTGSDATALVPAVRQTLRELDPGVALTGVATIDELVDTSLERPQSLSVPSSPHSPSSRSRSRSLASTA